MGWGCKERWNLLGGRGRSGGEDGEDGEDDEDDEEEEYRGGMLKKKTGEYRKRAGKVKGCNNGGGVSSTHGRI